MNQEKEHAKQFLRKELKHHNFNGVIHFGSHGDKSIDVTELLEKYAKEFAKAELEKNKFDATELWNKATKFDSALQTNGYWKALSDLERLGVIKMSEIEE